MITLILHIIITRISSISICFAKNLIPASKIKEISRLAHIHLENDEASRLEEDLKKVFEWVESIEKLPLQEQHSDDCAPSDLREDKITDGHISEKILKNAPTTHAGYFTAPKVIGS